MAEPDDHIRAVYGALPTGAPGAELMRLIGRLETHIALQADQHRDIVRRLEDLRDAQAKLAQAHAEHAGWALNNAKEITQIRARLDRLNTAITLAGINETLRGLTPLIIVGSAALGICAWVWHSPLLAALGRLFGGGTPRPESGG